MENFWASMGITKIKVRIRVVIANNLKLSPKYIIPVILLFTMSAIIFSYITQSKLHCHYSCYYCLFTAECRHL